MRINWKNEVAETRAELQKVPSDLRIFYYPILDDYMFAFNGHLWRCCDNGKWECGYCLTPNFEFITDLRNND